ncbi:MAG: ATP-dependent DNA ligase [Rhodoglobus sp.]
MGYLLYGLPAESIEIDDRTLAHIKIVMLAKLRRDESFAFSFEYDLSNGSGRSTVWVHPTIPIQFKFLGSRQAVINRAWLEALIVSANSVDGLRILPEPEDPAEEAP